MCQSSCQGTCKDLITNTIDDPIESLTKIITGLNHFTSCTSEKPGMNSGKINISMINMNALKEEARLLLNEVNIHGGCSVNRNAKRTGYSGEYVFEGLSFRDRIKQLKQRIQQLEKSV